MARAKVTTIGIQPELKRRAEEILDASPEFSFLKPILRLTRTRSSLTALLRVLLVCLEDDMCRNEIARPLRQAARRIVDSYIEPIEE